MNVLDLEHHGYPGGTAMEQVGEPIEDTNLGEARLPAVKDCLITAERELRDDTSENRPTPTSSSSSVASRPSRSSLSASTSAT